MAAGDLLSSGDPFTTAAGLAAGVSRGVIDGPRVQRLLPGVHVSASTEVTFPRLVAAARCVLPSDAQLSGPSALRLAGLAVGPIFPLCFVSQHPHQVRRRGLKVTRVRSLTSGGGVVPPWEAFLLSAASLDLVELATAGDFLVRTGRCGPDQLQSAARAWRGRGAVLARRAAQLVRERVDSARETELRLCLVLAGLPEPECNVVLGDQGEPVGRYDLVYRLLRLVLEYEGDQHRSDRGQWNRDILRHEALAAEGWRVLRVTAERLQRPRGVVGLVLRALRDAGYTGPDPSFSTEWRALFAPSARELRRRHAFEPISGALGTG